MTRARRNEILTGIAFGITYVIVMVLIFHL